MIYIVVAIYLALINIVTFALYGIDKNKAKKGKWRIQESTLIILSFIGGSIGALLGMIMFHHKTKHPKFYILVPLSLILHIAIIAFAVYYLFTIK